MTRNFFKRLFDKDKKFVFTSRNIARNTGNGEFISSNGGLLGGMYFIDESIPSLSQTTWGVGGEVSNNSKSVKPEDSRTEVAPKDVFEEIKKENTPEINFENLSAKIKVVQERIKILKEHLKEEHLMDEHRALFYLQNRLKYIETRKKLPLDWATTTQEAVDDLCKRYKLRVVPLKQYYTLVPKDGIEQMERYTKSYKAITGDEPIYNLVIKDKPVETRKKDRDPILLANSPLGNHLFILGAWDDDVEVVDEIIYGLK